MTPKKSNSINQWKCICLLFIFQGSKIQVNRQSCEKNFVRRYFRHISTHPYASLYFRINTQKIWQARRKSYYFSHFRRKIFNTWIWPSEPTPFWSADFARAYLFNYIYINRDIYNSFEHHKSLLNAEISWARGVSYLRAPDFSKITSKRPQNEKSLEPLCARARATMIKNLAHFNRPISYVNPPKI